MRGAPDQVDGGLDDAGIIPADAGSTSQIGHLVWLTGDHPRRCGEHPGLVAITALLAGSSPQMRGARCVRGSRYAVLRIIPADAGSTGAPAIRVCSCGDHPRRCGEHYTYCVTTGHQPGSSPQMRGAPVQWCPVIHSAWIIPADAGSTHCVS